MKAKAKYLDKEIEFEGTVVDGKTIIPHSVLQELAYENGVEYHYCSTTAGTLSLCVLPLLTTRTENLIRNSLSERQIIRTSPTT